jgi:hypothetical protein
MPVTTGVTETVSKSFRKYLSNIPEKHTYFGKYQCKSTEHNRFNTGNSVICIMNSN